MDKDEIKNAIIKKQYELKWFIWNKRSFLFLDTNDQFTCKNNNSINAQTFDSEEDAAVKIEQLGNNELFPILINVPKK